MERFDPRVHQPHPPRYFLYICLGRLLNSILHDANLALVIPEHCRQLRGATRGIADCPLFQVRLLSASGWGCLPPAESIWKT